jgi:hypothetical protein
VDIFLTLLLSGVGMGTALGVLGYFLWGYFIKWRWPISTPVAIQRGNGFVWDYEERARLEKTKDGKEYYKLRKNKDKIKPPKYAYVTTTKGGKAVYPLYKTTGGQYFPLRMDTADIKLRSVLDKSNMNWAIQELAENDQRYQPKEGWMQILLQYVAPISFAIMVIFFIIYFSDSMQKYGSSLSNAGNAMAVAMEKWTAMQSTLPQTPTTVAATPPPLIPGLPPG